MAKALGSKKTGGRPKGAPNKKTLALEEICAKHGVDVFEALVLIIKEESDKLLRFQAIKEAAQYLYPKRKALEVSNNEESEGFRVIIQDYCKDE